MECRIQLDENRVCKRYEVCCDETYPDLFTSANPRAKYLMIGGLWMEAAVQDEVKGRIQDLRILHDERREIKWNRITEPKIDLYTDLIQLFLDCRGGMRFRCIAVEASKVNMALHDEDPELGFYKFYYQMLHHWIDESCCYRIFLDTKSNCSRGRTTKLQDVLKKSHLLSTIACVQALPSRQVSMIQLVDLLLGAASSRMNGTLRAGGVKERIVKYLEKGLGRHRLEPTYPSERKYNIFKIDLDRGRNEIAAPA